MSHSLHGSFTIYYRTQTEAQTLVSAGRTLRPPISGAHDRMRQLGQKSQLEHTQLKRNVRQLTRSIELCWRWWEVSVRWRTTIAAPVSVPTSGRVRQQEG